MLIKPKNNKIKKRIEPSVMVIFGFTGDLSKRKLIPALYHLHKHGLLDTVSAIFGVANTKLSAKELREHISAAVFSCCGQDMDRETLKVFYKKIKYVQGNFKKPQDMQCLARRLSAFEKKAGVCNTRLFYLAVPPSLHEGLASSLQACGFLEGCRGSGRVLRVVVEKPFGRDLASAKRLNDRLLKYFTEDEIYRIDHYLGKETVQNLLITRFADSFFEPVWNHKYIDHIQITVAEELGVEQRGKFYEETGALRDVVQNHMLQVLALTAMEPPLKNEATAIQNQKVKILGALRRLNKKEVTNSVVRAQYKGSHLKGKRLVGYTQELDVSQDSQTETFVALKLFIDNRRWQGVPFYLRTGKRLAKKVSEVSIQFKKPECSLFKGVQANVLNFQLQPNENISLSFMTKKPGFDQKLAKVKMDMGYQQTFDQELPEAYERLLLDWIQGDKTLFVRSDGLYEAWDFTTKILNTWSKEKDPISTYKAGSWGPKEAKELIERDGRKWRLGC